MGFIAGMAAAAGGAGEQRQKNYAQALQEKMTREMQTQRLTQEQSQYDTTRADNAPVQAAQLENYKQQNQYTAAQIEALKLKEGATENERKFLQELNLPKPVIGPNDPPDKTGSAFANWYTQAAVSAYSKGFTDLGDKLSQAAQRMTGAYSNVAGTTQKLSSADLNVAKTEYTKQWKARAKTAFENKMAELKVQQQGANGRAAAAQAGSMQRAYLAANSAMTRTVYSADAREAIALQTAVNMANRQYTTEEFQSALHRADAEYRTSSEGYIAGLKAAGAGHPLPNAPAQPTYNFSMPAQPAQGGSNVNVVLQVSPDGKGGFNTTPVRGTGPVTPPQPKGHARIVDLRNKINSGITQGHKVSDPDFMPTLRNAGYTDAEINEAVQGITGTAPAAPPKPPMPTRRGWNP